MKLTGMTITLLALALASCERPTAENRKPAPSPPVATAPPMRQIAAPGNYFLRRPVSITTDAGIAGYPAGTAVRQTSAQKYKTADGQILKLAANDVTNDLNEARALAGRDVVVQAALTRIPVRASATPPVVVVSRPATQAAPVPARAIASVNTRTPAPPIVSESPLNRGAYGRTEAFVDTDGDGRKFDLRQPSRVR